MCPESDAQDRISAKWSSVYRAHQEFRIRWWQSPCIIDHINRKLSPSASPDASMGLAERALAKAGARAPFAHGVSVGCGNGFKEINLMKRGLVRSFTLFELADEGVRQARELAAKNGFAGRVEVVQGDAFDIVKDENRFDFVHWNNSLHHMMDVEQAVAWSHRICKPEGMFYMDDFVGPSRFQWTDRMLEIASAARRLLPKRYLRRSAPQACGLAGLRSSLTSLLFGDTRRGYHPVDIHRPDAASIIAEDPSEAADSGRILEAIRRHFPDAEIINTGGVIYHMTLNDILANFDEERDRHLLELLLTIDDLCAELGHTHYATALAFKH